MGDIIGGVVGGIGSLFGGNNSDKQVKSAATLGYQYLNNPDGPLNTSYVPNGTGANDMISQLLGVKPVTAGTQSAFDNYLKSTGYNFQLDQGTKAITGSAAKRGILNSGATAKALMGYGQGLASTTFGNYLKQLSDLSGSGLNAVQSIGQAGTQGGSAAANAMTSGNATQSSSGIGSALGDVASLALAFL